MVEYRLGLLTLPENIMKRLLHFFTLFFIFYQVAYAQQDEWKIIEGNITTQWADEISPEEVLPEYPRPQMARDEWQNLNGLWDYTILPKDEGQPQGFQGQILVPFAVESALSGVKKRVGKENVLWYKRSFEVPADWEGHRVLLHFGAVDWEATIFINGTKAGIHQGGYDPFSFDITDFLTEEGQQEIIVSVWDPTDEGPQPRGKQFINNEDRKIWYTPVTGIWQTVWLEPVPETYISSTRQTPNIDQNILALTAEVLNLQANDRLKVSAWDGENKIAEEEVAGGTEIILQIPDPKLWSPDNPFLYGLHISVVRNGNIVDEAESYFAMRKISMEPDENGIQRMLLNNEFVFQYGLLDQGWWPDGLYTAPSDEALLFDIEKTKEMGFNMIRKHIKVEPARWYYHTDKLGLLVWQDMPSGDMGNQWNRLPGVEGLGTERERTEASQNIFRKEWAAIMDTFHNFPSIVVWVPFNEAWGQFNTVEITEWTMGKDPSRLVNSASGGNFFPVGHIIDFHNYPDPAMPRADLFGSERALALGEFGGIGLQLDGHTWQAKDNYAYKSYTSKEALEEAYAAFVKKIPYLIRRGLSAAVYTQTTDVEKEINGLMTYDRKIIKIDPAKLRKIHKVLYEPIED
jgi:beta-galactosidase/beta-glucuronidase